MTTGGTPKAGKYLGRREVDIKRTFEGYLEAKRDVCCFGVGLSGVSGEDCLY